MSLYGRFTDAQPTGNLFVGKRLCHECQHVDFTLR